NVDEIEEVRVTTSPVDAELGRGTGQVELLSRSGTNEFHGNVHEFHRNTVLDANNWFNNLRGDPRDTLIWNQFGGGLGGPIRRQRTFFYFTYEGMRIHTAEAVTSSTYTETARQGTFRFFPGVQNGNANASVPTVDLTGKPVRPASATGDLQTISVFGRDFNRRSFDSTGTVQKLMTFMPLPNDFRFGDGLNIAGYTWRRRATSDFDHYNVKIDHMINDRHRVNFSFIRQDGEALNVFLPQPFPRSPSGLYTDARTFYSFGMTSTLSPTMVNEFHAGAQRALVRFNAPWELPGGRQSLPALKGYSFLPVFGLVSDPIRTDNDPQGRIAPLYQYGDTIHWVKGKHQVKLGGTLRFVSGNAFDSFNLFFQDDFRLKPSLTLNFGARYEFYGVPWEANGRAAGLVGGSNGLFGVSGTSWSDLYEPGLDKGSLTTVQLVGRNSSNPNTSL